MQIQRPLAAAALALMSLASLDPAQAAGPVALGRTVREGGISITPERVVEDSRCPMNARCMQAGRLVLRTLLTGGRWRRVVDLEVGTPVHVADGMLTLVSVSPDKVAGRRYDHRRLRFAFSFQGGI